MQLSSTPLAVNPLLDVHLCSICIARLLISALSFVSGGWGLFLAHFLGSQHPDWALPNVSAQQMLGE